MKCRWCPTFCFLCYGGTLAEGTPALSAGGNIAQGLTYGGSALDVGRLVRTPPIPNTFGYRLCCRGLLSISTQPAASATGLVLRTSGGPGWCNMKHFILQRRASNVCLFHYFHSRTSPTPDTHTWTMAAQSTVQLVLVLIHTLQDHPCSTRQW